MGDKRTHAARLSERQRLAVQTFSILGAGCDCDVTVEAEGMGLASPGSEPARDREGLSGVATRLVDPPDSETGHPRIQKNKCRPEVNRVAVELLDGACDQPERLVSPTSERVGGAERCRRGVNCPDLPQVGVVEDPLENPRCTWEMPAMEKHETEGDQCEGQREGMIGLLTDPHGGLGVSDGRIEPAKL